MLLFLPLSDKRNLTKTRNSLTPSKQACLQSVGRGSLNPPTSPLDATDASARHPYRHFRNASPLAAACYFLTSFTFVLASPLTTVASTDFGSPDFISHAISADLGLMF
jgi:hypothetical protein